MTNKLLSILTISSAVLSTTAIAQTVTWDYSAQLRLRNEHRTMDKAPTTNRKNRTQMRARLEFNAKVNDNMTFHMAPQATKNYGQELYESNSVGTLDQVDGGDAVTDKHNSSGDQYHSSMTLFEAYVQSKKGNIGYKLGRQQLNYGDNIILGNRNWTAGGLAFDAVKFMIPVGKSKLDIAYATISDNGSEDNAEDDSTLAFAYFKAIESSDLNVDAYVINNENKATDDKTTSVGFRIKGNAGKLDYRTENIAQNNHKLDSTEHDLNLEVGYKLSSSLRTYISLAQASENYDQLYTNRHKYNGVIDMLGRRNLNTYELGFNHNTTENLSFDLKYFAFTRKDKGTTAAKQNGKVLTGDMDEEALGQEVDFYTKYKLSKNEKVTLALSQFMHGDYFANDEKTSTFAYLEYDLKF